MFNLMELIKNWAVAITLAVLIGALLETLLPESGIKKYVRMAIGIMVIIVIISPVMDLFGSGTDFKEANIIFPAAASGAAEQNDMSLYKDYVYEVYMRNNANKNE